MSPAKKTLARKPAKKAEAKQAPVGSLDNVMKRANKKFGPETIMRGSDLVMQTFGRATTGSLSFDVMLGGGWPVNKWNEIIGNPSNGKTVMALKTIAANQALDPGYETLWVASEYFVLSWAETLGCDLKRIAVVDTNIMEEAYQIVVDALDNRDMDAVVIDSLPALLPSEEAEQQMTEFVVGVGARLTNKFMRKTRKAAKRSLTDSDDRACLALIINQWREKIGVTYGDPRTTPGGKGKDFEYFTRVEVVRDDWIKKGEVKKGITIKARTSKNKTAPPQRIGTVDFYFEDIGANLHAGDYDRLKEVFSIGTAYDIIELHGSYYQYSDVKVQGGAAFVQCMREDPQLYEDIATDVLDRLA